jgi:hypothetical protein
MFNGEFRWFERFKTSFQANFKPAIDGHNVQYFTYVWNKHMEHFSNLTDICFPMSLEIEDEKTISEIKQYLGYTTTINGTFPYQVYTAHRAFLLLQKFQSENNTKFDLYIRMRPDIAFPEPIDLNNFDAESVYFKRCHSGTTTSTFLCDFAYFTRNYDAVQKMANFGKCLDAVINDPEPLAYREFILQQIYCPEELLARYVKQQDISAKLHSFELDLARHK